MLPKLNTLHRVFWWATISLVNGYKRAKNNIVCFIAVFWGKRRKKTTCQISDGLPSCTFVEQEMIISIWCSTTTYYMLAFLLDPHNSKQKSQRSCLRPGKLNAFSFHSHNLSPFTSNFKFRFPCKDCLCKQICPCPSVHSFSPKAWFITRKYVPRISGITGYIN